MIKSPSKDSGNDEGDSIDTIDLNDSYSVSDVQSESVENEDDIQYDEDDAFKDDSDELFSHADEETGSEEDFDSDSDTETDVSSLRSPSTLDDYRFEGEVGTGFYSEHSSSFKSDDSLPSTSSSRSGLWPTLFPGQPKVIYFKQEYEKVLPLVKHVKRNLCFRTNPITPKVVESVMRDAGFKIKTRGKLWLATWGKCQRLKDLQMLKSFQYTNHHPMSYQLGRKDCMTTNLQKMRRKHGSEHFHFLPTTFILPRDEKNLKKKFHTSRFWIMKPPAAARGQGIKVIRNLNQIPRDKPLIVSKYVDRPLLVNGHKFDLRLYVLVTSLAPLCIYLYDEGLVRFASMPYSRSRSTIGRRFMHLTNYSVNRHSETYLENEDSEVCNYGNKWSLTALKQHLQSNSIVDWNNVQSAIEDLVIKTIISAHGTMSLASRSIGRAGAKCYEVYGFDVLLDSKFKPWLMEVNVSPSLQTHSPLDWTIKRSMIRDTLNLVGIRARDSLERGHYRNHRSSGRQRPLFQEVPSNADIVKHKSITTSIISGGTAAESLLNITPYECAMLKEYEDAEARRGRFKAIYPTSDTNKYFKFMSNVPYEDHLFHQWSLLERKERIQFLTLYNLGLPLTWKYPKAEEIIASAKLALAAEIRLFSKIAVVIQPAKLMDQPRMRASTPAPPKPTPVQEVEERPKTSAGVSLKSGSLSQSNISFSRSSSSLLPRSSSSLSRKSPQPPKPKMPEPTSTLNRETLSPVSQTPAASLSNFLPSAERSAQPFLRTKQYVKPGQTQPISNISKKNTKSGNKVRFMQNASLPQESLDSPAPIVQLPREWIPLASIPSSTPEMVQSEEILSKNVIKVPSLQGTSESIEKFKQNIAANTSSSLKMLSPVTARPSGSSMPLKRPNLINCDLTPSSMAMQMVRDKDKNTMKISEDKQATRLYSTSVTLSATPSRPHKSLDESLPSSKSAMNPMKSINASLQRSSTRSSTARIIEELLELEIESLEHYKPQPRSNVIVQHWSDYDHVLDK